MNPKDAGTNDGINDYHSAVQRVLMSLDGMKFSEAYYVLEIAQASLGTTKVNAHTADINKAMNYVDDVCYVYAENRIPFIT